MFSKSHTSMRVVIYMTTLMVLGLALVPSALAVDPPAISVSPVWHPGTQLDSIDTGVVGVTNANDDLRYVDADINVTTSVQFWATDITCTVDKNILEAYTQYADSGTTPSPDDVALVTEGSEWSSGGGLFQKFVNSTVNTDGKINFAITRLGVASPIGSNGVKKTFVLATLRLRVKDQAAGAVFPKTSPLTCTGVFLDKNGKSVLAPTFAAATPLNVIAGYQINGKVSYQDQTVQTGIVVQCMDSGAQIAPMITPVTATGTFTALGRKLGTYYCYFYGSKINPDTIANDAHLTSRVSFNLTAFNMITGIYNILPVTLRAGNVDRVSDSYIGYGDISAVTANWNASSAAYGLGDANGDGKTNNADLAIVSGNLYTYFTPTHIVNASHLIYSLPRDNEKFMDSHIWIGGYYGDASVSQFVAGTERNYWATLSPDGSKIAFVRNIGVGNADKFALFVAPVTAGVVGAAINITPAATFDAFAPSWSPDGTTIAFACAYTRGDWTDGNGHGNLCLINTNGTNLRQKIALPVSNDFINIHPVAWFNNTSMLYGAPDVTATPLSATTACNYEICMLDLATMTNSVDPRLPFGADMPTIRTGVMGPVVFYRYSANVNSKLSFAELNESLLYPVTAPNAVYASNCASTTVGNKHCDVALTSNFPGYNKIGYFNVYAGNTVYTDAFTSADNNQYGIVVYPQDLSTADGGGTNLVLLTSNGSTTAPTWGAYDSSYYSVANVVGNPSTGLTDFNPATENFMALRNTVEWVP